MSPKYITRKLLALHICCSKKSHCPPSTGVKKISAPHPDSWVICRLILVTPLVRPDVSKTNLALLKLSNDNKSVSVIRKQGKNSSDTGCSTGSPQGCRHTTQDHFYVHHGNKMNTFVRLAVIVVKNNPLADLPIMDSCTDVRLNVFMSVKTT